MTCTTIPGVSYLIEDEGAEYQLELELATGYELERVLKPRVVDPTKRNTKRIGDISEAKAVAALTALGFHILLPLGENHRYDLVIDDGETLQRVQVKTGRLRGGVIVYSCISTHAHRGGTTRPYFGEIEFLAVYCPETDKVYLLPEEELTASKAHLRVSPTRNQMVKTIRWAADFELA